MTVSVLPLTTLAHAKAYLGSSGQAVSWSDSNNTVATQMLLAISQEFENFCSHHFAKTTETEMRFLVTDFLWCQRWPVASITSVYVARNGRQSTFQQITDTTLFEVDAGGKGICIYDQPEGSLVKYTYVGGLAESAEELYTNYPDLEDMCLLQFAAEWARHNRPDRTGLDLGNTGNTTWTGEIKMLDNVKQRLSQAFVSGADFL